MTFPDEVECSTCGGTARRTTWGATAAVCYRCSRCHAGGHIAKEGGRAARHGGVFKLLNNQATREVVAHG